MLPQENMQYLYWSTPKRGEEKKFSTLVFPKRITKLSLSLKDAPRYMNI